MKLKLRPTATPPYKTYSLMVKGKIPDETYSTEDFVLKLLSIDFDSPRNRAHRKNGAKTASDMQHPFFTYSSELSAKPMFVRARTMYNRKVRSGLVVMMHLVEEEWMMKLASCERDRQKPL